MVTEGLAWVGWTYGFSPVCFLIWSFRTDECANACRQTIKEKQNAKNILVNLELSSYFDIGKVFRLSEFFGERWAEIVERIMLHRSSNPDRNNEDVKEYLFKRVRISHVSWSIDAFACAGEDVLWTFCCIFYNEKLWCSHDSKKCASSKHRADKMPLNKCGKWNLFRLNGSEMRRDCWVNREEIRKILSSP